MTVERLIEILQDNNPNQEVYIETLIKDKGFTNNNDTVLYDRGILDGITIINGNLILYSNNSHNLNI